MSRTTIVVGARMLTGPQKEMIVSTKAKKPPTEVDKGVPLAPSEKDLKPWYSDKGKGRMLDDMDNDMRYAFKPVSLRLTSYARMTQDPRYES